MLGAPGAQRITRVSSVSNTLYRRIRRFHPFLSVATVYMHIALSLTLVRSEPVRQTTPPESGQSPGQTAESLRPSQPPHARRRGGERHRGRAASVTVCRAARADGVGPLLNPRGSEQVRPSPAPRATPPNTAAQRTPACRAPSLSARRTNPSMECMSTDMRDAHCAQESAAGANDRAASQWSRGRGDGGGRGAL